MTGSCSQFNRFGVCVGHSTKIILLFITNVAYYPNRRINVLSEHFIRKYSAKRHNITVHHNNGGGRYISFYSRIFLLETEALSLIMFLMMYIEQSWEHIR
jgi:hypothetical protein